MKDLFKVGELYSRSQVLEKLGLPVVVGGSWYTGYAEHAGSFFIFANVGTAGRTGHDYPNKWEGARLRWCAKTGTTLSQPQIQRLLSEDAQVHVYWRAKDRSPFQYEGLATPLEVKDTSPIEILWSFGPRGH